MTDLLWHRYVETLFSALKHRFIDFLFCYFGSMFCSVVILILTTTNAHNTQKYSWFTLNEYIHRKRPQFFPPNKYCSSFFFKYKGKRHFWLGHCVQNMGSCSVFHLNESLCSFIYIFKLGMFYDQFIKNTSI